MTRHHDDLVRFDVPRDWEDRTIVAYRAPRTGDGPTPNVVVTRDRMIGSDDLATYAERHLRSLAGEVEGFQLKNTADVKVDGHDGVLVGFTSRSGDRVLAQRMTLVALPDGQVITITMTAAQDELAQLGPLFERIQSSLRLGPEGGA